MNTLAAKELKRRGVAALEELLQKGPVHIIKNNQPTCVVISEEQFAQLNPSGQPQPAKRSVWEWLKKPPTGTKTRQSIDRSIAKSKKEWD